MGAVHIGGSWGELTVDPSTGRILTYDDGGSVIGDHGPELAYHGIAFFDPADVQRWAGGDILAFGYWTKGGAYAEPLTMRLTEDRRGPGHGMEFDDWTPFRLLPAPRLEWAVCVNAYDGEGEYTDKADETEAFSLYVRTINTDTGEVQSFDYLDDVRSPEAAAREAEARARQYGGIEIRWF